MTAKVDCPSPLIPLVYVSLGGTGAQVAVAGPLVEERGKGWGGGRERNE